MTLNSLSNYITTRLGHMKAWAAGNLLDWVTCFLLHFTLAYIVYISRITDPSSCLHTCTLWRLRWNVHWYWQLFDWFVTLLHYLFSNEKDQGFGCQTRTTDILSPERVAVRSVSPAVTTTTAPHDMRIAQMSGQFSWSGGLCKNQTVWTVCYRHKIIRYNKNIGL